MHEHVAKIMPNDETKPSIKINIVMSFLVQALLYLTQLIAAPYLSRTLGAEAIGIYSFAYAYANYFLILGAFGFINFGARAISKNREDKEKCNSIFWSTLFVRLGFVLISVVIFVVLTACGAFASIYDPKVMYALIIAIASVAFDITFYFRGIERFKYISIATALANALFLVAIFVFVRTPDDLLLYTIIKSVATMLSQAILWFFLKGRISAPKISKEHLIPIIKGGAAFFLPSLVMTLSASLDQTLIGIFANNVEVAYYQQTSKITTLLSSIIFAISPVILSRMVLLNKNGEATEEESSKLYTKSLLLALAILVPITTGLYLVGAQFIPLYFGSEFAPAVPTFYWLLPVGISSALTSIAISGYFFPKKMTWRVTFILLGIDALNVGISTLILLTTDWGAVAAAIGSAVSDALATVIMLVLSRKYIRAKEALPDVLKMLLGVAVMFGAVYALNYFVLDKHVSNAFAYIGIDALVGIVVYGTIILLTRESFAMEGIALIRRKLLRRKPAERK